MYFLEMGIPGVSDYIIKSITKEKFEKIVGALMDKKSLD
jgi:response regulator of citrate/malate metabolism